MKVAILILAHKDKDQLEKLIQHLSKDFDIYIHIDKKWNIDQEYFSKYKNVTVLKEYRVSWGSYNQILATLSLFKSASNTGYDFYMLISGQDLPIKSNQYIIDYLKQHRESSFVNYEKLPKRSWLKKENGGFDRLHFYWGPYYPTGLKEKTERAVLRYIRIFQRLTHIKRKLDPLTYYGGWNWVNLNREAMKFVIDYVEKNPSFLIRFKHTMSGDEIWVQTILLNSNHKIVNNDLRYVDWNTMSPHPRTLLMEDLDKLESSESFFARKFDMKVDKEIVEKIYSIIK